MTQTPALIRGSSPTRLAVSDARVTGSRMLRGLLLLGVLVAAMVALRTVTASTVQPLGGRLADFVTLSLSVAIESLPFVFLGIVLSVLVQVWLPPGWLLRRLPRIPALRRGALSLLGVLLPVCECGNVPLARALLAEGLTVGDAMTFLLAAPILNPVTIVTTFEAFGWNDGVLVSRVLGGFVIANLVGFLFSRHPAPERMLTPAFAAACAVDAHGPSAGRVVRSAESFVRETGAMMPALLIGSAIAGAIQVGVPRDVLVALGANPVYSVLALVALAFVVSICSNVDAIFILSVGGSFLPGGIVAFLVFGPMVDVKMLALLRTTFRIRPLLLLTAIVALSTIALGFAVNVVG